MLQRPVGQIAFQLACSRPQHQQLHHAVVTKLFNLSISTGSFPQAAKSSVVVPAPKSTDHILPSNYWPISLLTFLSKVLEKDICSLAMDEL